MKRACSLLAAALLAACAAGAQQAALQKVPRTVFFAPAQVEGKLDAEAAALVAGAPEMLATSVAARQPFARVDSAVAARSQVAVAASSAQPGKVAVSVTLRENGVVLSQTTRQLAAAGMDLEAFRAFIEETATRFAPSLGLVDPEADILKVTTQKELIRAVQETTSLAERDKRLEFTLWASGLMRLLDSTGSSGSSFFFVLDIMPLIVEASWYLSRDFGLQLSFYFNDTNAFDFGERSRRNAYGLFLFPGIGIVYRTLGEVSAEYAMCLSVGWIRLTATDGDVVDKDKNVVLAEGRSTWSKLAFRLRIAPALVWSITPSVALKTGIGFDLIMPGMFSWYTNGPLADFQYLAVAVGYRL